MQNITITAAQYIDPTDYADHHFVTPGAQVDGDELAEINSAVITIEEPAKGWGPYSAIARIVTGEGDREETRYALVKIA